MKKLTLLILVLYLAGCRDDGGRKNRQTPPPTPAPASIQLSVAELAFTSASCGSNPASQTFEITNAGAGTLVWSASNLPAWLILTPESGTAPNTVTAQVDAAALNCGETYSQSISITATEADNTPITMTVTLTIPAAAPPSVPMIGINPSGMKLIFETSVCGGVATSTSPTFDLLNSGTGSFSWSGSSADSWIQFSPLSGSDGSTVTVQNIDTIDLPCGATSSGTITITSAEAGNSPQSVTVEVKEIPSEAKITPSATGLGFFATTCKGSTDPQSFTIQNTGGTPLGWSAAVTYKDATGWLSIDTTSGTVAPGATSPSITVAVDASALDCGQGHSATITLTGSSGGNNVSPVQSRTIEIGLSNPVAWEHQNPKSASYPINDVTFSEEGVAWAVGDAGTILRSPPDSPDYGNNWISVVSGTSANLRGIHFINPREGWIVGGSGTILQTVNGGATWDIETSPTTQHLQSVYFLDASHGWAVGDGGTILFRGNDATWTPTAASGSKSYQFTRIFMNDAEHGWITANDLNEPLFWTKNNWAGLIPQDKKTASQLYSIFFLPKDPNSPFPNRLEGWAVGENGSILHIYSDTGLESWTTEMVASGTTFTLRDLFISTPSLGWAIGGQDSPDAGTILQWNGAAWSPVSFNAGDPTLPSPLYMWGVAFNSGKGVAVGNSGIVFTTANGTDWENVSGPSVNNLTAVTFALDGINGWAVGDAGTVLSTSNGGTSWVREPGIGGNFTGLSVVSATDVWAVTNNRQIYHYSSGSWGLHTTLAGSFNLKGVHFANSTNGWAVGRVNVGGVNRHVYYYNGTSWSVQAGFCDSTIGTTMMNSVHFVDASRGWVVGAGRWIARTTDGGTSWTCTTVGPAASTWNAVHFIDASTGWVVGSSGRIYKTTDGGANWSPQASTTTTTNLLGVRFSDANNGWVVGGLGFVAYTQNGGSTWTRQLPVGTNQSLNGIYFTPGGLEGWAVGDNGVILHTLSGGVN
jgi:photosystem II stability/assembly factor-like uncharacterized protein